MPPLRPAICAALFCLAGCGAAPAIPWQEIPPQDSRVVFGVPDLAAAQRQTLWRRSPYSAAQQELSYWYRGAAPAAAQISLQTLAPGYAFLTWPELDELPERLGAQTGRPVALDAMQRSVNALGAIDHRGFRLGDAECVVFRAVAGDAVPQPDGIYVPTGNMMLLGYYCAEPGRPITPADRAAVLQALALRPVR